MLGLINVRAELDNIQINTGIKMEEFHWNYKGANGTLDYIDRKNINIKNKKK